MKQKRFIISLLITVGFLIFGKYNAQAEMILENQYTNPYYKDVIVTPNNNNVDMYSLEQGNAEYTSDIKKVAENFRKQLVNRENEITLYYYSDEPITGEHFNNLTSQLFDLAVQHTGKGNEGDYILWHCQGWRVGANCSSNPNGGFDMNITYTVSYLSDAAQEEKVAQIEKEVFQTLKISGKSECQWGRRKWIFQGGIPYTGWKLFNGDWYYAGSTGRLYTGERSIGGKTYWFNENGK